VVGTEANALIGPVEPLNIAKLGETPEVAITFFVSTLA